MSCADVLRMTIWQTPAGIVDEGGYVLPSWLNFGITLLGPPANGIMHVSAPSPIDPRCFSSFALCYTLHVHFAPHCSMHGSSPFCKNMQYCLYMSWPLLQYMMAL